MSGRILAQQAAGHPLEAVHEAGYSDLRRVLHQQVNMTVPAVHLDQLRPEIGAGPGEDVAQPVDGIAVEHSAAVLRHKGPGGRAS